MRRSGSLLILTALLFTLSAGCGGTRPQANALRYPLKGKVVSVDKDRHHVTVAHDEIPGFMEAMTMPFAIRDEWPFRVLAPGQQITATLVVEAGRSWLENITITQESVASGSVPPSAASIAPGTEVPDLALINQAGKRIHLGQYRGKSLLLTFVYTRCPLPDYCLRMSGNFAQIHKSMKGDAGLSRRLHLLTVSFDPESDTPEVLRAYGRGYAGTEDFADWEFATGTRDEVKAIASCFGLEYWPEKGQFTHTLRTALIGPDGKLVQLYSGNEWTPADVLRDLKGYDSRHSEDKPQ
jgi:protein SCO1